MTAAAVRPSMTEAPLLALDLATHRCGWCALGAGGIYRVGTLALGDGDLPDRLVRLGQAVAGLLDEHQPASVVVEVPDPEQHAVRNRPATWRAMFAAYGIVLECCRRARVPVQAMTAQHVRDRLVGWPTAGKTAAQRCLQWRGYPLPRRPDGRPDPDACDALALALVWQDEAALLRKVGTA